MGEVTARAEPVAAADRGRLRSIGVQCLPSGLVRDGAIPRLATMGALAVYLSVLASLLSGAAPAGYRLTVDVANVRNAQGVVGVLVFSTAQGWPEQFSAALRAEASAAHTGVVEITIPALPAGEYAVVVLHDENTNGGPRDGVNGIWVYSAVAHAARVDFHAHVPSARLRHHTLDHFPLSTRFTDLRRLHVCRN